MDVRIQKHRIASWLGRLLFVFAFVASCGVQADDEIVGYTGLCNISGLHPDLPKPIWCAQDGVRGGPNFNCVYSTPSAAAQAAATYQDTIFSIANPGNYVITVVISCDDEGLPCTYRRNQNGWSYEYTYSGGSGHDHIHMCCPVPDVNPSVPYVLNIDTFQCTRPAQCATPFVLDPATGKCVPPETYTIKLDPKSATLEPEGTAAQNAKTSQSFTATVTNRTIQQSKAGAKVTIKAEVEQGSGGHVHTDQVQRPKGYLGQGSSATLCDPNALQPQACITGTTDANGQFVFVFTSPEPSGKHTITATCDVCNGNQDQAQITVKVVGLVSLSASSTDYVLVGDTTTHNDNHYLTPTAKALAERLAIEYRKKFPKSPRLHFNDASLIEGGVLDICTGIESSAGCAYNLRYNPICQLQPNGTYACSWSRPHIEHRRGSVVDVRANNVDLGADNYSTSIPKRNEKEFLSIAKDMGLNPGRPHSPKSSNRHWHIRLLGVAE